MTKNMYHRREDSYNEAKLDNKGRVVSMVSKAPEGTYVTIVTHGLFRKKSRTYFTPTTTR